LQYSRFDRGVIQVLRLYWLLLFAISIGVIEVSGVDQVIVISGQRHIISQNCHWPSLKQIALLQY